MDVWIARIFASYYQKNSMSFRAIHSSQSDAGITTELMMLEDSDLDVSDVTVRVDYSTINYKDGLTCSRSCKHEFL